MKREKNTDTQIKFVCFVLAFVLLFSGAHILAGEIGGYIVEAMTKTASVQEEAVSYGTTVYDSGSYSEELFMPNYDTEVITKRNLQKPTVDTFGSHDEDYYPSYTNQLKTIDDAKRQEILSENVEMISNVKEWFAEGTLTQNLKKHVSADGQFYNSKEYANADRIEKEITVNYKTPSRRRSLNVFAPAGEVITVKIDSSLVNKGLTVIIGYPYEACDIGSANRILGNRMAKFYLTFKLTKEVTEIGSPLGGMVMLEGLPGSITSNFKITVSGGIDMPSYKLGASTQSEWQNILEAPAPYIWLLTPYIYFVLPKVFVTDIEDPYLAMLWWHKSAMISLYGIGRDTFTTPVISILDDYVPVGEAVNFTWGFYSLSPTYWSKTVLDYNQLMYTEGAWGPIHEFNHNNQAYIYDSQDWGVGGVDEITNNVFNAMSYIMLTDIALTRTATQQPANGYWSVVSDPYYNYKKLAYESGRVSTYDQLDTNKLFGFVDIIHTFGVDKFLDFIRANYGLVQVEGYDGTNLCQDGYLKTEDGYALLSSLFYKTDFVDYFTKVWHFNISSDVVNQIKSYGFDEYFSINNVFSSGIKGLETGRAFKIHIGTTNVLNFRDYTLCSTDDYELESVSEPSHGKLVDNGNGTYNYVPDDDFTQDSFDLLYKVNLNGKVYYRTLVVKLTSNYQYIETVTYNSDSSKRSLSAENAIAQLANDDNVLTRGTVNNFTASTLSGDNLTRFRASVVFPTAGTYTFMVYGDDKAYLKIGNETAYTSTYLESLDGAKKLTTNKITVDVTANKPLQIEAYCFNTGGGGKLYLKYSKDGENYQDIPSSYCYAYNVTQEQINQSRNVTAPVYPAVVDLRNKYLNNFYSNSIEYGYVPSDIKCVDDNGNDVKAVPDAKLSNMFDGDTGTNFHTAWYGTMTKYPHNYYFTFDEQIRFNRLDMFFNGNWNYYAIGDYELYASNDGVDYSLVYIGSNRGGNFQLHLGASVLTKYVKLVVKSNASGQGFTAISEIKFLQENDYGINYNIYGSNDKLLEYNDNAWQSVTGNYNNSVGMHTNDGTLKFYLTGTDLALYSINEQSTIIIDSVEYTIGANHHAYSPSFLIDGLTNMKHYVEIQAKDMTVDIIKTTGVISEVVSLDEIPIVAADQYYNGKQLRPILSYNGIALTEGVDYYVTSIHNNQNIGVATYAVKALQPNDGEFQGTFNILPVHLDNNSVTLAPIADVVYSGNSITPDCTATVVLDGEEIVLQEGTDFDVSYVNNTQVGTASIILTFKGNFSGTATGYFNIVNIPKQEEPTQQPSDEVTPKEPNYELGMYIASGIGVVFMLAVVVTVSLLLRKK